MKYTRELKSMFSSINISLTSKCNLSCEYCYRKNEKHKAKICSTELGLDEIIKNPHIKNIVLTGGEPTLYNGLDIIISKMENKNISIITNGVEFIPFLKNCTIIISLDGLLEHNSYRRIDRSVYNQIVTNILNYSDSNTVEVHTVLNNLNHKNLKYPKEISSIRKSLGLISKLSPKNMQLSQVDLRLFNDYIKNIIKDNRYHYNLTSTILNKKQFFNRYSYESPFKPFPEYVLETDSFNFFNTSFNSLKLIQEEYVSLCDKSWSILRKHLSVYNDDYLFDPYVELENEWFKSQ